MPGPHPPRIVHRRRRFGTGDLAIDLTCLGVALMGFNRWRLGEYPWSDFAFVAAAGIVVARLLTGRSRTLAPADSRRSSPLVLCGALILMTAGTISSFGAWNALASIGVVLRLAWLTLVWFWILRAVTTDREVFDRLLRAWRFGVVVIALVATSSELGLTGFTVPNYEDRQTAFFGHPNDLAGYLVAGLPLIVLWIPRGEGSRRVVKQVAGIALVGFALASTGSMSAIAGGAAGIATMFAVLAVTRDPKRSRRRHPLFVMLALTIVGIAFVLVSTSDLPLVTRITEYSEGDSGVTSSVESRGVRNELATDRVDELLVVGIGLDRESGRKLVNLPASDAPDKVAETSIHNMYLKIMLEAGLPALIGLWIILGTVSLQAWRLMCNLRTDVLHPTAAALFGSVVTGNVFAMFQPTLYQRYYWLPIALVTALWALRRRELDDAHRSSGPHGHPTPPRVPVQLVRP